ncbi:hypothetical protein [Pantoea sp. CCBC3-3-1]|uniref:hypothetical protein n=1 Tax=Pantoea sp. CCBC3-3-1 TaxID=2490851 RepID=UPI0011BF5A38|nr:hypothetical protein [Pantoea sp. CCBC3-3-1]
MNKTKNNISNENVEKKLINSKALYVLDLVFVLLIVACTWFFGQLILKNSYLVNLFKALENIPELLSLFPIFSSSLMIAAWFIYRGKSIKSLNDFILFFSVSYALYLFLFNNTEYQKLNNLKAVVNESNLFFAKIVILDCTIAKTLITLFEFVIEWVKENSEKELIMHKNEHSKNENIPSKEDNDGKHERFQFNYKYHKSDGNKLEHEEVSVMKFEKHGQKESESSSREKNGDNNKPISSVRKKPFKKKFLISLFSLSLLLLASPFAYSLFTHHFH